MLKSMEKSNMSTNLDAEKALCSISVVADMLSVHQRTLRIYDEIGLLSPSRSLKNRRLYSLNDIEKGKFIQYLTRNLGINLSGTKVIMHLLSQMSIPSGSFSKYIEGVADNLNITEEIQEENRLKLMKRGKRKTETV